MPKVQLREGETQQNLMRRFRNLVMRSGVLGEVRRKRWFIPRGEQRRIEKKKSIRRLRRNAAKQRSRS
ncbi:MAG: 30S ribosomal protein S21 [Chloroflexi bacterium]|nr:30S ribosomal protein S21 [Chloroflexota bacterium]